MRVIGVDPGYDRLGLAVLERDGSSERLIHSECVVTDRSAPLSERLAALGDRFEDLVRTYRPDAVGIETLFFNQNRSTGIAVAEARGVITFLAARHSCSVREFGPQEIKVAVTGYGKSDKTAVFDMLRRLITGIPDGALDDEYDAIAVGVTCLAHHR